jgi:hypothetical protein
MSRLVPEKRVDKNGVLTTKHVKVSSEKDAFKGAVPAPTLGAKTTLPRKLTKGQTAPSRRVFSANKHFVDPRLNSVLGKNAWGTWREFDISDEGMYSVWGVTDTGTGLALINAGYQTADAASQFLKENGLDDLLEDHAQFCNEVLERRISPESYLEALDFFPYLGETERDMDAMEAFSYNSIRSTTIYNDVYHGETRLEDVKAIGITRIAKARASSVIRHALKKLGSGKAEYTLEDLKVLIDKYPNHVHNLHNSLELAERYGMEFTLSLNSPDTQMADYLEEKGTERERLLDIVRYGDQVNQYQRDNSIYADTREYEYTVKAYDAKVGIAGVAEGQYTIQQLEAIIDGVEKSVSGGWL